MKIKSFTIYHIKFLRRNFWMPNSATETMHKRVKCKSFNEKIQLWVIINMETDINNY